MLSVEEKIEMFSNLKSVEMIKVSWSTKHRKCTYVLRLVYEMKNVEDTTWNILKFQIPEDLKNITSIMEVL